jgi:hypothetical protein
LPPDDRLGRLGQQAHKVGPFFWLHFKDIDERQTRGVGVNFRDFMTSHLKLLRHGRRKSHDKTAVRSVTCVAEFFFSVSKNRLPAG